MKFSCHNSHCLLETEFSLPVLYLLVSESVETVVCRKELIVVKTQKQFMSMKVHISRVLLLLYLTLAFISFYHLPSTLLPFYLQQTPITLYPVKNVKTQIPSNLIETPHIKPVLTDLVYFNRFLCIEICNIVLW